MPSYHYELAGIEPVIENLTSKNVLSSYQQLTVSKRYRETCPANSPADLISLGSKIVMPKLLDIKVVNLESRVSYRGLVVPLDSLEEKGVVIGILEAPIDVKETGYWFPVFEHNIGGGKSQSLSIPVVHLLIGTLRISHTVVAPAMN